MKKNLSFMALSTYLRIGSQLIVFILLARILGAQQFGSVAYWTAITILVALPVNYGFGMQLMREFHSNQEAFSKIVADTLSAKIFLSLLVLILSGAASFSLINDTGLFWFFLLSALADSYTEYLNYILRSSGQFQAEARLSLIISTVQFVVVIAVAVITSSALCVAVSYFFSRSIGLFFTCRGVFNIFPEVKSVWAHLTKKNIAATLNAGFPYAADMGVSTINTVLDTVLLKQYVSMEAVGTYQAGARLMLGGTTMASVINNVYLPKLSAYGSNDDVYRATLVKLNMLMLACGGMISLLFLFFRNFIADNLFGSGYEGLADLLPWFGLLLFIRYIAASFGVNLTALGHQKVRVVANILFLISFMVAVYMIVPYFGMIGMLISGCLSTVLLLFFYFSYIFYKKLPFGVDYRCMTMFVVFLSPYYFLLRS